MALIIGINAPAAAQDHEQRFLQGMMKEEGEGNLVEAIEIYTALANDDTADRSIRAKALLQMGICYEKLGKDNAARTFERLISEYAEQTDLTSIARKKLMGLKKDSPVVVPSDLVSERIAKGINWGIVPFEVSPDGRFYTYFESAGDEVMVYDLVTNTKDSLTSSGPGEMFWGGVWSANSQKVALTRFWNFVNGEPIGKEICLINRDGTNREVFLTIEEAGDILGVAGFSPDGTKALVLRNAVSGNQEMQELLEVTLATREIKTLASIGDGNAGTGTDFRYSPDGNFIAYSRETEKHNGDIFVLNVKNGESIEVAASDAHEAEVAWSPNGEKLLFISNGFGSNDLFEVGFSDGRVQGVARVVQRNLGFRPNLMGIDSDGAVYYSADNSRSDVYMVDLDANLDLDPSGVTQVSSLSLPGKNGNARYSKDGRYISFQNGLVNQMDGLDEWTMSVRYEPEVGFKYAIYVYDEVAGKTSLLDLDLYLNHSIRSQPWHVPTWSYFGNKLLVHGRVKDQLKGGFFEVDVETKEITPVFTVDNSVALTNYNGLGSDMIYSRVNKDLIYYSSPDWQKAMSHNRATGEEQVVIHIPEGFWFGGFLDKEETSLYAHNRFGQYACNLKDGSREKIAEDLRSYLLVPEDDNGLAWFLLKSKLYQSTNETVVELRGKDGFSKKLNLSEIFPDCIINVEDKHPYKNRMLISVVQNPGSEIYKLKNISNKIQKDM